MKFEDKKINYTSFPERIIDPENEEVRFNFSVAVEDDEAILGSRRFGLSIVSKEENKLNIRLFVLAMKAFINRFESLNGEVIAMPETTFEEVKPGRIYEL